MYLPDFNAGTRIIGYLGSWLEKKIKILKYGTTRFVSIINLEPKQVKDI